MAQGKHFVVTGPYQKSKLFTIPLKHFQIGEEFLKDMFLYKFSAQRRFIPLTNQVGDLYCKLQTETFLLQFTTQV